MRPETKQILEGIAVAFARDFDLAFNAVDPEGNGFTPAELFAKKYELMKIGEKATISASISIIRTGNFNKPKHKVKVSVTMKAATPDDDYQDLFAWSEEEPKAE